MFNNMLLLLIRLALYLSRRSNSQELRCVKARYLAVELSIS